MESYLFPFLLELAVFVEYLIIFVFSLPLGEGDLAADKECLSWKTVYRWN